MVYCSVFFCLNKYVEQNTADKDQQESRAVAEKPQDAVGKFDTYRNSQWHRAVFPAIARHLVLLQTPLSRDVRYIRLCSDFLQRVSTACYVDRSTSYIVNPSVLDRLSVCHTPVLCQMSQPTIMPALLDDSSVTSCFMVNFTANFQREQRPRSGGELQRGRKISQYSANKLPYLRNGAT